MDQKIIDLYNDYIHGEMPRRSFLRKVAEIAPLPAQSCL
jgi:hypothetical protein